MSRSHVSAIRAVLFDMDGTLFDSEPAHDRAWTRALESFGTSPGDWALGFVGVADHHIAEIAARDFELGPPVDEIHARKNMHYHEEEAWNVRLFPGVADRLAMIGRLPCARALVTSGTRRDVQILISANRLDGYFHIIVAAEDVYRHKPDPEPFRIAIGALRVDPSSCLALEDSESGYRSACAAGLNVITVGGKARPRWMDSNGVWIQEPALALDHVISWLSAGDSTPDIVSSLRS